MMLNPAYRKKISKKLAHPIYGNYIKASAAQPMLFHKFRKYNFQGIISILKSANPISSLRKDDAAADNFRMTYVIPGNPCCLNAS
jgi:hypothetical protein